MIPAVAIACAVVGIAVFLWLWTLREDWCTISVSDPSGFIPGKDIEIEIDGLPSPSGWRVVRVANAHAIVVARRYHALPRRRSGV